MHAAKPASPTRSGPESYHAYPWWSPRFWHGMPLPVWLGLLGEHRWRVSPSRLGLLGTITAATAFNSLSGWLSDARFALTNASGFSGKPFGPINYVAS